MTKLTLKERKDMARKGKNLSTLVNDSNYEVRMIVARYPKFANQLKDDTSALVRREVAKNGSEQIRKYLINDSDKKVRQICYNDLNLKNMRHLNNETEEVKCEIIRKKSLVYWPFIIGQGSSFVDKMAEFVSNDDKVGEQQLLNVLSR